MKATKLYFPQKYLLGPGVLEKGLKEAKNLGEKAVIITGKRWAIESGTLGRVEEILMSVGIKTHHVSGISPNPDAEEIDEKAEEVKKFDPDFVVGLGGGSVLDATKAISLVARSGGHIWDYVERKRTPDDAFPIVAISTVAASGSDFDGAAVINNRKLKAKMPISHPNLVPKISIIDVELHRTVPLYTTAIGCVDIFCQFYEPFIMGEQEFRSSGIIALSGMKLIVDLCPRVLESPENIDLRGELAYLASLSMSGIARAGRGGGFSMHWLEHVLSGHYPEIPHAQGLASLIVAYTKHFIDYHNVKLVSTYLTGKDDQLPDFLNRWLSQIGVNRKLRDLGVRKESLKEMARDVVHYYGWINGKVPAPEPMDETKVLKIYETSW